MAEDYQIKVAIFHFFITLVVSQNESSHPLSDKDFDIISGLNAGIASVAIPNPQDLNLNCRLVHECKKCNQEVQTIEEDIYSEECNINNHVKNCRKLTTSKPFEKRIKICHVIAEKVCSGPCQNCPEFCQPNKQFWCEDNYTITSDVEVQNKVWRSTENIILTRGCFEKTLDPLCATLNCKFVTKSRECMDTVKTIMVNLTTEECDVCQPIDKVEKLESSTICVTTEERNCPSEAEARWVKKCLRKSLKLSNREPRGDEDILNEVIPLHDLFEMAAKPARDLLFSKKQELTEKSDVFVTLPTTEASPRSIDTASIQNLKVLNDRGVISPDPQSVALHARNPQIKSSFFFTPKVKPEDGRNGDEVTTVSEYFDPIHNVIGANKGKVKGQTENFNNEDSTIKTFETSTTNVLIIEPATVLSTSIVPPQLTSTVSTATTSVPTTLGTTTTPTPTTEQRTIITSTPAVTITQLELTSITTIGTGEQFAENLEKLNEIESSKSPAAVTTSFPETVRSLRITPKEQARLCLFHGICDDGELEKFMKNSKFHREENEEVKTTTTTKKPTTSKPQVSRLVGSPSDFAILAQIQRCIQTPEFCNTNLIRSGTTGSSSAAKSTQTSTIPTLTQLDSRNCGQNGNCEEVPFRTSRLHKEQEVVKLSEQHLQPEQVRSTPVKTQHSDLTEKVRLCLFSQIC